MSKNIKQIYIYTVELEVKFQNSDFPVCFKKPISHIDHTIKKMLIVLCSEKGNVILDATSSLKTDLWYPYKILKTFHDAPYMQLTKRSCIF